MRISHLAWLLVLGTANLQAAVAVDNNALRLFTDQDMYRLAEKARRSLRKCKQLRQHPDIVVDVQNKTEDFFDKTKFAELIHSQIEGKTHNSPDASLPQYELQAELESVTRVLRLIATRTYTLTVRVFQEDEKLCEKKISISKNHRLAEIIDRAETK